MKIYGLILFCNKNGIFGYTVCNDIGKLFVFGGKVINAKSIMHLMAACIKQGSELEIRCEGQQEAEALKAAVALVEAGLGDL